MPRYIENLNSCSDPTSGDYLWLVDASASASDKDRKVDVGLFARLAAANVFSGAQTVPRLYVDDTNHAIDTEASGALALTSQRVAVADNGVVSLGYDIKLIFIVDATNGNGALFMLRGGVNGVQEIFDPSGVFSATKDTASSFNIYYESSDYKLQNKRGASKNVTLFTLVG